MRWDSDYLLLFLYFNGKEEKTLHRLPNLLRSKGGISMKKKTNIDHVFYRNPTKYYPTAERGEGIYIYDTEGKRYIDGSGGAVVVSIGHGVKEIQEAMLAQANLISFTHGSQFTTEAAQKLAERLVGIAPPGLDRVYYLSGGSEAIECSTVFPI